jgi:putative intracellular protease/amidase
VLRWHPEWIAIEHGFWLEEVAARYFVFRNAGVELTVLGLLV